MVWVDLALDYGLKQGDQREQDAKGLSGFLELILHGAHGVPHLFTLGVLFCRFANNLKAQYLPASTRRGRHI